MTPRSFEFTISIPGDSRLVGAIRGLAAHAAGYAQLAETARQDLAGHVERATEAAIARSRGGHPPIDLRFTAEADALTVVISYHAETAAGLPAASDDSAGVMVDWKAEQSRHVCHIRQRLTP